jgi:hypothetical protein
MEIDVAYSGAKGSPVYLPSRASYRSAVQTALDWTHRGTGKPPERHR